jgi:hypothetical protein
MNAKLIKVCWLIIGMLVLLMGCSTYDHRAASVSPEFPPAPPTPDNDPDMVEGGNR